MLGNRNRRLTIEPMLRGGAWIVTEIEVSSSWREEGTRDENTDHPTYWKLKRIGKQHIFKTSDEAVLFMHKYYDTQKLPFVTR
jgi:hypothetical protein